MPYRIENQVTLESRGKVLLKAGKGDDAIAGALDELEEQGWALVHLVQHSSTQGLTKFVFHRADVAG